MLGKLIKYDLKSGSHIMFPAYIFIILCAVFSRIMDIISDISDGSLKYITNFLFILSGFILILSIVAACVITLVWVVLRYRNNLLRDEGYLMHTLPVSQAKLYFSKMAAAMLFFLSDIIVIFLSIILSGLPQSYGIGWDDLKEVIATFHYGAAEYKINGNIYIASIIILIIIALYLSISQLFISLNIGYSLPFGKGTSRDLISVAVYIATYTIMQIVMVLIIIVPIFISSVDVENEAEILRYTQNFLFISIIVMAAFSAICNTISIKIMQKKLNLE